MTHDRGLSAGDPLGPVVEEGVALLDELECKCSPCAVGDVCELPLDSARFMMMSGERAQRARVQEGAVEGRRMGRDKSKGSRDAERGVT